MGMADTDHRNSLSDWERAEITGHGLSIELAARQLHQMREGVKKLEPSDAVRLDNGFLPALERRQLNDLAGRFSAVETAFPSVSFIPAAGEASRLFRLFREIIHQGEDLKTSLERLAAEGRRQDSRDLARLFRALQKGGMPFSNLLARAAKKESFRLEEALASGDASAVFLFLLQRMRYEKLPKALLAVHSYGENDCRSALEEHIRFAVRLCPGPPALHFAVSREHRRSLAEAAEVVRKKLRREKQAADFLISFSCQDPATDALVLDLRDGRALRHPRTGRLVIRRAGHGALLDNLDQIRDFHGFWIRNIDNVTREGLNPRLITWRRAMRVLARDLEEQIFAWRRLLESGQADRSTCKKILVFIREKLFFRADFNPLLNLPASKRKRALAALLDRPLAVVGYVPLPPGQKGGGGFILPVKIDCAGLELTVEKATTIELHELAGGRENELFKTRASHFNPVDLYLTRRDFRGRPFNLLEFADPQRAMVDDKDLFPGIPSRIWEHPGLWNGGMARVFQLSLAIPAFAFAPVKELQDLLHPAHRGK